MIERIPRLRKAPKNIYAYAINKIISGRIEEKNVKESLDALLNVYMQQLNAACLEKPEFGRKQQMQAQDRSLSSEIHNLK